MPPLLFTIPYNGRSWILIALPGNGRLFKGVGQFNHETHIFHPEGDLSPDEISKLNAYIQDKVNKGK